MSDYGIHAFVRKYKDGSLQQDITYRAYDLESIVTGYKAQKALRQLGYRSGDFGIDKAAFTNDFKVTNAVDVLAMWWVWHRLCTGRISRAKLREFTDE